MIHKEEDDGFNPIEGETVAAMIARLKADPAVMAIYNERQEGAKEARNKSGETLARSAGGQKNFGSHSPQKTLTKP